MKTIRETSKVCKNISKIENILNVSAEYVLALPPVSLSSTRISSFSNLQGISGSSPITVRVASNSPSTLNFTRPFATQTPIHDTFSLPTQLKTKKILMNSKPGKQLNYTQIWRRVWASINCLPTVRLASWGGKSVVTRRCRRIWLSWFRVVCFSTLVMGSGGMILSCRNADKRKHLIQYTRLI